MLPMVGVPDTIRKGLRPYRDLFRRAEGVAHVSRYITGLSVSPNKTLQGSYGLLDVSSRGKKSHFPAKKQTRQ